MKPKHRKATKADLNQSILINGKLPPEDEKIYRKSFEDSQEADKELREKICSSRILSAEDFNLRINT